MNAEQPELELGIEFPAPKVTDLRTLVEGIVEETDRDIHTPYQVHVIVNLVLQGLGTDYRVRPQMMYNYDRNGMIVRGSKSKMRFTNDEVIEFVTRFTERNRNR